MQATPVKLFSDRAYVSWVPKKNMGSLLGGGSRPPSAVSFICKWKMKSCLIITLNLA